MFDDLLNVRRLPTHNACRCFNHSYIEQHNNNLNWRCAGGFPFYRFKATDMTPVGLTPALLQPQPTNRCSSLRLRLCLASQLVRLCSCLRLQPY